MDFFFYNFIYNIEYTTYNIEEKYKQRVKLLPQAMSSTQPIFPRDVLQISSDSSEPKVT